MEKLLQDQGTYEESIQPSTTYHGIERTMERMGVTEQKARLIITKAWNRGNAIDELSIDQRRYLEARDERYGAGNTEFRVYRKFIFVFSPKGALITMFETSPRFNRKSTSEVTTKVHKNQRSQSRDNYVNSKESYNGKDRVRNPHHYNRLHSRDDYEMVC